MKPLSWLALAVLLAAPARAEDDIGSVGALKKDLKGFKANGAAPDQPRPRPEDLPRPPEPPAPLQGRPLLFLHYASGAEGLSVDLLEKDLANTAENVRLLSDYLYPSKPGGKPLAEADRAWALAQLGKEDDAARSLIAQGERAVAKGIARAPLVPGKVHLVVSTYLPNLLVVDASAQGRSVNRVIARSNVAVALAEVVRVKRLNPPKADEEVAAEKQYKDAREFFDKWSKSER